MLLYCCSVSQHVQLFVTQLIVAHQSPLSMEFSRQEHWSGLPFPPPGHLPDPGIICIPCVSCIWQMDSLPLSQIRSSVPGQHTTYTHPNMPRVKYQPSRGSPCAACYNYSNELIQNLLQKAREFQKNIYFCLIDYAKAFDCVGHIKLWNILKEMGIPDRLTCLLRNLYAGQEATVRPGHGTTDWFQIRKGEHQGCLSSSCLFNLYAEYIM